MLFPPSTSPPSNWSNRLRTDPDSTWFDLIWPCSTSFRSQTWKSHLLNRNFVESGDYRRRGDPLCRPAENVFCRRLKQLRWVKCIEKKIYQNKIETVMNWMLKKAIFYLLLLCSAFFIRTFCWFNTIKSNLTNISTTSCERLEINYYLL